jgi:hypothetical protein
MDDAEGRTGRPIASESFRLSRVYLSNGLSLGYGTYSCCAIYGLVDDDP